MNDLYLKFPDEATAKSLLYRAGTGLDAQQQLQRRGAEPPPPAEIPEFVPLYRNIDTIGIIYERTGGTDEEPVMTPISGWHVNVRLMDEDGSALEPYAVTVATPVRVWA